MDKRCSSCSAVKPPAEFAARKVSPDGLNYKCRTCNAATAAAWRAEHPGAFKRWVADKKEARSEEYRLWAEKNREQRAAYMSKWGKKNAPHISAKNAHRNAAKFSATPAWADLNSIADFYRRAKELTALTGVRHEVDHFYPLQGRLVCGLHCEANLRVITKVENIRKLNRMPEEAVA